MAPTEFTYEAGIGGAEIRELGFRPNAQPLG